MNLVAEKLSAEHRKTLAGLADVLIPSYDAMPSASDAEVPNRWIDDALTYRPDLLPNLLTALDVAAGHDPSDAIEMLNSQYASAFEALGTLTAGAYFLNPRVRELLGYPGQIPTPVVDDTGNYVELLGRVVDRGPIYRDPTLKLSAE